MNLEMRNTFIRKLTELAFLNDNIVLMVGDLGYSVVEEFQSKFPTRFYNAGICEQNMASMAAGLASEGFHVFIYSIANFPTFRCAEQIRNDIGYHNLAVTVVAVGGGLSYGNLGYSHHAIQDLGLMRLFPEFVIATPGDPIETANCIDYLIANPSPSYLRLKKAGEPNYNSQKSLSIQPGIWNMIKASTNRKIFLTVSGGLGIVSQMIEKEPKFAEYGIYTCPVWGARYKEYQQMQIDQFDEIITIEDHLLDCGFGSWIRESIKTSSSHQKVINQGLSLDVIGKVGSEKYLLQKCGFNL